MALLQIVLILSLLTAGCGGGVLYQRFDKSMWANFVHLNQVSRGMTRAEVEGIMGPPQIKEEGDFQGITG